MKLKPVFARILPDHGKVVVLFSEKVEFNKPTRIDRWEMDPKECLDITEAMATAAFEARDGVKPVGEALKAELVERHRQTLNTRLALVLNSTRENRTVGNEKLAQQLVDICLAQVF